MKSTETTVKNILGVALLGIAVGITTNAGATPKTCTYRTYEWSTEKHGPVNHRTVSKPYDQLRDDERDPNEPQCTVCEEDQASIDPATLGLHKLKPIRVCRLYQKSIEKALTTVAQDSSFKIVQLVGYRVGRTRGPIVDGKRTVFSNHSFGTAIDVNSRFNAIYTRCNIDEITPKKLKSCKKGIGGPWSPHKNHKTTIQKNGILYRVFTEIVGWKWGGEIPGKIKDLMHFSITGY